MKSQLMRRDRVTLLKPGPIRYVNGVAERSEGERRSVDCQLQPLNGRELQMVPEGDREKEQYWLTTEDRCLANNDQVEYQGRRFQVQAVEPWPAYLRVRIVRIDVQPAY